MKHEKETETGFCVILLHVGWPMGLFCQTDHETAERSPQAAARRPRACWEVFHLSFPHSLCSQYCICKWRHTSTVKGLSLFSWQAYIFKCWKKFKLKSPIAHIPIIKSITSSTQLLYVSLNHVQDIRYINIWLCSKCFWATVILLLLKYSCVNTYCYEMSIEKRIILSILFITRILSTRCEAKAQSWHVGLCWI